MATPMRTRILMGVVPAMVVPAMGALFYFVLLTGTPIGRIIYVATKTFTLIWPILAVVAIEGRRLVLKSPDLPKHVRAIPAGLSSGIVIAGLIIAFYEWTPLGDYVRPHHEAIRDKIESLGIRSLSAYFWFSAFMALCHSLLEEYFWRWYVFGRLTEVLRPPAAYGLASLAFAGHHYVVLGCYFPTWIAVLFGTGVGIGGGLWCWLYQRQESLVGVWLSHLFVDAAIVYVGYRLIFL